MADYEDGQEEKESEPAKGATYKIDYKDHSACLNMLGAAQDAEHDLRENARESILFVTKRDGQWEPYWWSQNAGKPRYTFDMTSPIVDQICSELEQASFDIRITPGGGDATKDLAMTYDGMVRNIENMSSAKAIYRQAARGFVTGGLDGWMVTQKFVDSDSFDQDLVIEKIPNFIDRVWFDPTAEEQDKADSRYWYVLHPVSVDEYEARWPDGSKTSVSTDREGEAYYDKAETILIGQFFYCKEEERELVLMSNGQVHEANEDFDKIKDELAAAGVTEKRRRKRMKKEVCSRYFDASDWLEEHRETVFDRPNVIPVYANFQIFENKTLFHGAVEKMIDYQRVYNYAKSREIEEGALAPRAKYWMTLKQGAGHEAELATMNTNSDPVQFFNPDPENPGVPQQNGGAQVNPGLVTISASMREGINQSAGMFAANMGDNPGLQSGVAIQNLQNKGDNGTIKYFNAMEVAIAATGRVIVKAIPKTYDSERAVRVLYEDQQYDMVDINQTVIDEQSGETVVVNDLSVGKYDVVCTAGPSFQSRQQETLSAILDIAKIDQSIIPMGGDLLLKNIPTPVANQLAERKRAQMIKQGIIPIDQLTDDEKAQMQQEAQGQQQQQDPAMVLAMAEQTKGQAELMNAQTNAAKEQREQFALQLRANELQYKMQQGNADTQIESYDSETKRMLAQVAASKAGASLETESVKKTGMEIDNAIKLTNAVIPKPYGEFR